MLDLALVAGLYLIAIDTVALPEVLAGAAAVVPAVAALRLSGGRHVALAPWLARVLRATPRLLLQIGHDIATVSLEAVLVAQNADRQRGALRAIPFSGGGDEPRARGRRALAEALGSLPPNTLVLGVDADSDVLLVHELTPARGAGDPLGLG
ncbi:MAG TPA: hypothetical protein VHX88_05765 [Solirubrobacteraceae bacterium]|nr:hypothetical protein [Solirubrobacteraceae bacterium]